MNNLKRVLSLGLSGVMLAGLLTVGASAADFTDAEDIQHTDAVNTLVALNVINGKDDGSFAPEENVSRSQMAKMIAVAMNGGNNTFTGTKTTPSFTDIKGHWAEAFIEYCADLDIISGRGDGTFDPDATVTGIEATKMVLTALGYNAEAYQLIGAKWASRTDQLAQAANPISLYDQLAGTSMNAPASRDVAAQLIWNGLQDKTVKVTPGTSLSTGEIEWNYNTTNTKTLLEERYGALIWVGNYVGNGKSETGVDEGCIKIDNADLETVAADSRTKDATFPSDLDISNIGEEVKVIFKDGKGGSAGKPDKKDTIYGVFNTGRTEVVNAIAADVEESGTATDGEIKIDGTKYKVATPTEAGQVVVVKNYGADDPATAASPSRDEAEAAYVALSAKTGDSIKFILDEGKVAKAFLVNTKVGVVSSKTSSKITITGIGAISLEDNDVAEDLAKDDVVTYTKFYSADRDDAFYTVAKAETVEGEITGYTGTKKVSVDGTSYKIAGEALIANLTSDSMTSLNDQVGTEVVAYLANGYVVAIDNVDDNASNSYALVTGSTTGATNDSQLSNGRVRLLLTDGTETTYDIDKDTPAELQGNSNIPAGTLVKYSLTSSNTVEIKEKVATSGTSAKTIWNADTKKVADDAVAASNAVLYLKTSSGDDFKVYDIRTLKTLANSSKDIYLVKDTSGKVTVAYVPLEAEPAGATSSTVYGMVIADRGVGKIGDTYVYGYTVWAGDREVEINIKGQSSTLSTGKYVYFDEANDTIYASGDVKEVNTTNLGKTGETPARDRVLNAAVKEYSTSDKILSYYTDLYKTPDNVYAGKTLKTDAMGDDAQIIYVNRDGKKAGDEIGVNAFEPADGYANVKIVLDKDGAIAVLFVESSGKCDVDGEKVKGTVGGSAATEQFTVELPAAATSNGVTATVTADKSVVGKGEDVTYTITMSGTANDESKSDTFTFAVSSGITAGASLTAGTGDNAPAKCSATGLVITVAADAATGEAVKGVFTIKCTNATAAPVVTITGEAK